MMVRSADTVLPFKQKALKLVFRGLAVTTIPFAAFMPHVILLLLTEFRQLASTGLPQPFLLCVKMLYSSCGNLVYFELFFLLFLFFGYFHSTYFDFVKLISSSIHYISVGRIT